MDRVAIITVTSTCAAINVNWIYIQMMCFKRYCFLRVWSPSVIPVSFLICILQGQQLKQVYKQTTVTEGAKCNCCLCTKRQVKRIYHSCTWTIQANIEQFFSILWCQPWWTNIFPSSIYPHSLLMDFSSWLFFFWYAGQIKRRRCHQMLSSICIYSHYIPRCWDFMAKVYNLFRRNFTCAIWSGTLNLNLVGHKKTSRAESWIHSSMTEIHIIKKKQRASVLYSWLLYTRGCWSINQRSSETRACVLWPSMQNSRRRSPHHFRKRSTTYLLLAKKTKILLDAAI